jgi:sulfoxide reductase heme-binding subunit YedZ
MKALIAPMRKIHLTPLKLLVHTIAIFLIGWLLYDYFSGNLTVNPIQAATQRSGRYAIAFLTLSLAATPANTFFRFRQALTVRRMLGLYAFLFASLHVLLFVGVDYRFDLPTLADEVLFKPYILVGLSTMLILIPLAVTSFRWWMKRLGRSWTRLHRLVYLAGVLVVIHYTWAIKGDLTSLQGEIGMPLFYALAVTLLLIARLPPVRRTASGLHTRYRLRKNHPAQAES